MGAGTAGNREYEAGVETVPPAVCSPRRALCVLASARPSKHLFNNLLGSHLRVHYPPPATEVPKPLPPRVKPSLINPYLFRLPLVYLTLFLTTDSKL